MRSIPFAAALLLVLACKTQTPAEAAREARALEVASEKIAVACQGGEAVAPAVREAVEATARANVASLRGGDVDGLWTALHPQARDADGRAAFVDSLRAMQQRLVGTSEDAELEQLWVVDVSGGVNDLARVSCGDDEAPTLQMMANVGGEDIAVVSLLSTGDPFTQATTVQLRRRGEAWRLVGLQVNPAKYRGKSAAEFFALADELARQKKAVSSYLLLGVAQTLATRGAALRTPLEDRIGEALEVVRKDPLFAAETGEWDVGGDTFSIEGLSLAATQGDLSPVVKYVNERGLVQELLGRDADKLMDHVRTQYPELGEQFDAVVFEAYAERPTEPGRQYEAYRIARFFDASRDQPPPPQ